MSDHPFDPPVPWQSLQKDWPARRGGSGAVLLMLLAHLAILASVFGPLIAWRRRAQR
jgi:uncharacterized Tic20 family protein